MEELLKLRGLTRMGLAKKAGVTYACVHRIMAGKRFPLWRTLEKLAAALDVPPEQLYRLLRDQQRKEASVGV